MDRHPLKRCYLKINQTLPGLGTTDTVTDAWYLPALQVVEVATPGQDPQWIPVVDVKRMVPAPAPEVKPVDPESLPAGGPSAPPRGGKPKKPAAQ